MCSDPDTHTHTCSDPDTRAFPHNPEPGQKNNNTKTGVLPGAAQTTKTKSSDVSPGALPVAAVPTEPAGATTGEEDGEEDEEGRAVEEDGPPSKAANPPLVAPAPEEAATGANTSVRRRTTRYLQAGTVTSESPFWVTIHPITALVHTGKRAHKCIHTQA